MKKKLIIAAAIAFAVFAIPCGSSALSTVSVASENNTVAPTPAPVVDVDKVKVSIDNISITDVSSADEAVAILKNNIGIQTLRAALWQSYDLREELYGRLEQEYADVYKDPLLGEYLVAEVAVCRIIQQINKELLGCLDFEAILYEE